MKSTFYYGGHYSTVAEKIKNYINTRPDFLSQQTIESTRAAGDAIEYLIKEKFCDFLGNWCSEYSNDFARRAMGDLAFADKEGFYHLIDVKTQREATDFNMPNLTSVERLARFYKSDNNVFSLIMAKYAVTGTKLTANEVIFSPIEYIAWDCLTVGALGWGQIQIANSNVIHLVDGYSRKKWMLQLCETMQEFYPKEICKIQERILQFDRVKAYWQAKKDIWE